VVSSFLSLCENTFSSKDSHPTIAIHCIAGLGRAPVLVAIALLENDRKFTSIDVVTLIRKNRKNAFNSTQLKFIEKYQRRKSSTCKVQ
jgi:protein tyrosine phosphatase type 4A